MQDTLDCLRVARGKEVAPQPIQYASRDLGWCGLVHKHKAQPRVTRSLFKAWGECGYAWWRSVWLPRQLG